MTDAEPRGSSPAGEPIDRAVAELRALREVDTATVARIMETVRHDIDALRRSRWPRRGFLLPMWAVGTAAVAVLAVWAGRRGPAPSAGAPAERSEIVQFVVVVPEAQAVSLVGSFNDWDPNAQPLVRRGREGIWSVEVALAPGHHEYAFNVDGTWRADDDAPLSATDEFGFANSVIVIP